MEQSCDGPVTAEEIEVANILLELPHLIFEYESRPRFSFTWGAKRKRSNASKPEVAATSLPALKLSPSQPPSLPSNIVGSTYETEALMKKALTSSPATPLSFSPSESDEKPLPSKKKASVNSLKQTKEQLLEMMEDFTRRNELLKKDIENKRLFLNQQKAENLELKAKKQKAFLFNELSQSPPKAEESRLETSKSLNFETQLTQISVETQNTTPQDHHHYHRQQQISTRVYQQPFIMDQMVCKSKMNKNPQYPYARMISWLPSNTGGLSRVHDNVGPLGLLDLNFSVEEAFGFSSSKSTDLDTVTKARAAQARLKGSRFAGLRISMLRVNLVTLLDDFWLFSSDFVLFSFLFTAELT
ncbi:uncharacterized protein LOC111300637 [Durio zibethinus]|uniref:Uncharacterized protein LOC111300637 n=1 Tax=Durio zibethinus TaxID=66656 RepID=A0A6P5ZHP3_DURZI|nr:uncharacterized protein LOC111300637 [Durio zibethinus]